MERKAPGKNGLSALWIGLTLSLASQVVNAEPVAQDVVARCAEALGGKAAWDSLEQVEMTGTFTTFSVTHPFRLRKKRPDFYRFDHKEGDRSVVIAFDGEQAWWHTGWTLWSDASWPVQPPVVYARSIRADALFAPPCVAAEPIEYQGKNEVDTTSYHQLLVSRATGDETWYLDETTYLPVLRLSQGADMKRLWQKRTFYSDYQTVGSLQIPHAIEVEVGNRHRLLEVESVALDVPMDPRIFVRPIPREMAKLADLAGTWQVTSRQRVNSFMPWQESSHEIRFSGRFDGELLVEEGEYAVSGRLQRYSRQWTYDRFEEVYRVSWFDPFTAQLAVLEGQWQDGWLVADTLAAATAWSPDGAQQVHRRLRLGTLAKDGFVIQSLVSKDAGGQWLMETEMTFSRSATGTSSVAFPVADPLD